jgi:catechol 2,3-dioxygenase-like lactoylglutathione lyase family enzyme
VGKKIDMKKLAVLLFAAASFSALTVALIAADDAKPAGGVQRPKILGVAHIAFYVTDLQKTRAFWKDFLGYEEPFSLKKKDGSDRIAFIKINDNQYIELFAEEPKHNDGQLNHISFYTEDAHKMRDYLASKGVKVPEKVGKGQTGNFNYNINDPDGHTVEIVEYQPDSWTAREKGKFIPDTRISTHMAHVGVLVASAEASMKFYHDILGFNEFWRGGGSPKMISWVNMRVPDGDDYLELMLYNKKPEPDKWGTKNHLCLIVPDVEKAVAALEARPARKNYSRKIEIQTGVNRKRQANLYDPDGSRIELMEPNTIDGKPTPSSTAPLPVPTTN